MFLDLANEFLYIMYKLYRLLFLLKRIGPYEMK